MTPADIYALIKAIPALVGLFIDMFKWVKDLTRDDPAKFISDAHAVFSQVTTATTPEEKLSAAKSVQDLIRRL